MSYGPLWDRMDAQPRRRASELRRIDVPLVPGVYAWYRRGRAVYVGKGDQLRERAWGDHMGQSTSMGSSAFRRNVAEFLGFGAAKDIKKQRLRPTPEQLAEVRAWIVGCSVAWIEWRHGGCGNPGRRRHEARVAAAAHEAVTCLTVDFIGGGRAGQPRGPAGVIFL